MTTQTLKEEYNGEIPDSVEKLCKLTGVGPKTARIYVAWRKATGIGVDTHVHRICNRIHWVEKPTASPEDTRKALEAWLPFELWDEVNHLLVGFGQTICLPIGPNCEQCLNNDICPSRGIKKSLKKKPPMKPKEESDSSHIDIENAVKQLTKNMKLDDEGVTLRVQNAKTAEVRKVSPKKAVEVKGVLKIPGKCDSNSEAKVQKKRKVTFKETELKQAALGADEENLTGSNSDNLQIRKRNVILKKQVDKKSRLIIFKRVSQFSISVIQKKTRKIKVTPVKSTFSDGKTKKQP